MKTLSWVANQLIGIISEGPCDCHESGSHSLKLHITHGLHFPSCTALTHSRPPLHQSHSCHHSLINWLPHHTCTSFSHSHKSSTQTLTQCEVLFSPGYISERSPIHPAISVFHPGLPDLGSLNLCLWPRLLPGIVYVSALPLIFLFLPADLACLILPIKYCCKWIHSPLTIPYRRLRHFGSSSVISTTQPNYGQHRPTPTSSPGRPDYGGVCSPVLWAVLPGPIVRRVSIQGLVLFWTQ